MAKQIKLKKGQSRAELKQEILETYSISEILDLLIDYVELDNQKQDVDPVVISMEQFKKYFRIRGYVQGSMGVTEEMMEKWGKDTDVAVEEYKQLLNKMSGKIGRGRKKGSKNRAKLEGPKEETADIFNEEVK